MKPFDPTPKEYVLKRIALPDKVVLGPLKSLHVRLTERIGDTLTKQALKGVAGLRIEIQRNHNSSYGWSPKGYEVVVYATETEQEVATRKEKWDIQVEKEKARLAKQREDRKKAKEAAKKYYDAQAAERARLEKSMLDELLRKYKKEYDWSTIEKVQKKQAKKAKK